MEKLALLIGVSEYEHGLDSLPSAVRDVDALQQVLQDPRIGGFRVDVLKNPERQTMADRMYDFFSHCQKEDLLLFYFSGHGILDHQYKFHLSSRSTRKNGAGLLIPTTAIAATEIHTWLAHSTCKAQKQVVILDCCNAGAFPTGMTTKAGEVVIDIKGQLGGSDLASPSGGKGRVILTAATSTQYAFEQEGLDLSVYSHYLVEGLAKGAADLDGDGQISVEELHEYVAKKVREAAPAMTPEIYNLARDTKPLQIARSPKDDPPLKYRKEVEKRCDQGRFSIPAQRLLKRMQLELKLSPEVAEAIEAEVMQPWKERERKLQEYHETLKEAFEETAGNSLSDRTLQDLQDYQQYLGLRDEDIQPIHAVLLTPITASEPIPSEPAPTDKLASEKGIDYTQLRDLLASGDWKQADRETYWAMIQAMGKEVGDYFAIGELENFPCTDLETIDSLWIKYSNGKFGFSVQKRIWQECGSPTTSGEDWDRFCVRVGWQNQEATDYVDYEELKFNLKNSPVGELPGGIDAIGWGGVVVGVWTFSSLAQRLVDCDI